MPNEDRYLAVTAKRNRRSTASDLSRQLSSATGTTVSRFSLQSDSRRTLIWRVPGIRYHQPLNDTITVVQDGSFGKELFLVPELTCMFRV
ncbi:HTH_Tnp_Tc3_2 domain-containing protein [Trichonephila clavipes]|nr:HTH_Tnp_Tc3_2 domain-containing protein [Trichonephila clavipes]